MKKPNTTTAADTTTTTAADTTTTVIIAMPVKSINELVTDLNALERKRNAKESYDVGEMAKIADTLIKRVDGKNAETIKAKIAEHVEAIDADRVAFWNGFIDNHDVIVDAITIKDDLTTIKQKARQIRFSELETAYQDAHKDDPKASIARNTDYVKGCNWLSDNLKKVVMGDLTSNDDGVKCVATATALKENFEKGDRWEDFSKTVSITVLRKQLDFVMGAILPDGISLHARGADVRALVYSITKANRLNVTVNTRLTMNALMDVMKKIANKESYSITVNGKGYAK